MSFLEIFFSICSGVKVFQKLKDVPLSRALFHFVALGILAAFFITFCRYYSVNANVQNFLGAMSNEFGCFEVSPSSGILPGKDPKRKRSISINENLMISYFPDDKINLDASSDSKYLGGIIWTPGVVAWWNKYMFSSDLDGLILTLPIARAKNTGIPWGFMGSRESVIEYLKANYRPEGPFKIKNEKFEFENYSVLLVVFLLSRIFIANLFVNILISGFLFVAIFMLMFSLMESRNLKVDFKRLYVIGLYAAFPAVFIASLFPALNLPFFDYNTVFLFCFLAYILFVISSLKTYLTKNFEESNNKMERQ